MANTAGSWDLGMRCGTGMVTLWTYDLYIPKTLFWRGKQYLTKGPTLVALTAPIPQHSNVKPPEGARGGIGCRKHFRNLISDNLPYMGRFMR